MAQTTMNLAPRTNIAQAINVGRGKVSFPAVKAKTLNGTIDSA